MKFFNKEKQYWLNRLPGFTIVLIALFYLGTDISQHNYLKDKPENRGVIHWDVISYYAYLPATFIYGDVTLEFLKDPPEGFVNDNKFWPSKLENGNFLILTSMGLSVLYAPFFFIAHGLAPLFGEPRDGFGIIYQFFLVMGTLVYVILGFIILKNILRRYFSAGITAFTLIAVALGTNLYHFSTTDAAMSHAYSFFLITLFLKLVIDWHKKQTIPRTIFTGLVFGLIVLIRPTNILVLIILLLWDVKSWPELWKRIRFFLAKIHLVIIMLAAFILIWIPQFLYWKEITGHYLYFTYSTVDGAFYWGNPHIIENLFSYKKGWFVYVPIMFFAVLGIPLMQKRKPAFFWPVAIMLVLMIYVFSAWWSWWYGGCLGMRPYIDIYGIMAVPLASTLEFARDRKAKLIRMAYPVLIVLLILFQLLNNYQYRRNIIHYVGMNRTAYWKSFLRLKYADGYWQSLTIPDYYLARRSMYYFYDTGYDNAALKSMSREDGLKEVRKMILEDRKLHREIINYAKRTGISDEEAMKEVTQRIYENLIDPSF